MIRYFELLAGTILALAATGTAWTQALPEYSAGAAGSAGASGAIGNNIGGIIGNLEKSLPHDDSANQGPAKKTEPSPAGRPATSVKPQRATHRVKPATAPAAPESSQPAPKYEDPSQIQLSLAYDEMLRRFGPPAMEITTQQASKKVLYMSPSGTIHIEVVDGVVTSAPKPKS